VGRPEAREEYLRTLGIDAWVPRAAAPAAAPAQVRVADAAEAVAATAVTASIATGAASTTSVADLESLVLQVSTCTRCALCAGRTQTVFGVGSGSSGWMVVGEGPGAEEDRRGEPFVGPAGKLLDAMLAAIDLPRAEVFIANVVKCRPPNNRDPLPEEIASCLPYLARQVELLRPRIILAVGRIAAQALTGASGSLGSMRGRVHEFGLLKLPLVVTYHPAYLLREPGMKRQAWEDLKFARRTFAGLAGAPA
jgi:DNA polymerase